MLPLELILLKADIFRTTSENEIKQAPVYEKSTATTIPFFKNNEFDYAELLAWTGEGYEKWAWLIFIPMVIFIITAVSNGANLNRWYRWFGGRNFGGLGLGIGDFYFRFGKYYFLQLFEHYVHPLFGRNDCFYFRICWGINWVSLVQFLSSLCIYG